MLISFKTQNSTSCSIALVALRALSLIIDPQIIDGFEIKVAAVAELEAAATSGKTSACSVVMNAILENSYFRASLKDFNDFKIKAIRFSQHIFNFGSLLAAQERWELQTHDAAMTLFEQILDQLPTWRVSLRPCSLVSTEALMQTRFSWNQVGAFKIIRL